MIWEIVKVNHRNVYVGTIGLIFIRVELYELVEIPCIFIPFCVNGKNGSKLEMLISMIRAIRCVIRLEDFFCYRIDESTCYSDFFGLILTRV